MVADKEKRTKNIEEITKVIEQSNEDSEGIGELFWALFSKEPKTSESAEADEIRLRKICNSRFFNAYFLLESGEDVSRPDEVDAFVAAINRIDLPEQAKHLVSSTLKSVYEADWIRTWIPLLRTVRQEIKAENLRPFIEAICEFANGFGNPKSPQTAELMRNLAELNIDLVSRLSSDGEATNELVPEIRTSG